MINNEILNDEIKSISLSSEKLLMIMEFMAKNNMPARLQEISKSLDMSQSTLSRYLSTLIKHGYVYQDKETLKYLFTWKICKLGFMIDNYLSLRFICGTYIKNLAIKYKCAACLVVLDHLESIYLDLIDKPDAFLGSLHRIGKNAPLHTTGSGKIFLSNMTNNEIENYIKIKGLVPLTHNTIVDIDSLFKEINKIKKQGYACDNEECEKGVRCVSVPLRDFRNINIAAISLFSKSIEMNDNYMRVNIIPSLIKTSKEISYYLGCCELS